MARRLFIAAIEKNSGKTTTSIGLMHLALKKYRRVGYLKPFGGQTVEFHGRTIDKDVALMAQEFDLSFDLKTMSPVVLSHEITHQVVDGVVDPEALTERIVKALAQLEERCELVFIEGSGHPGVGSILKISNARIAHLLEAPVLLVTGGGLGDVVDRLALIQAFFDKEAVDLKAILVNKLFADKRERTLDYLRRALAGESYRVLGGFDYQRILANPTLRRISTLLNLPVQGNSNELDRIIYRVLVGAASTQRFLELLTEPSLIIVNSSRNELLVTLAHLYQIPEYHRLIVGLVISGSAEVNSISRQILEQSRIPFLRARGGVSADLYQTINKDVSKTVAEDREKIDLIRSLADKTLDFAAIEQLFSV
ncbi:cobyrinic acid a,c-diamide synthase [Geomonas limicola]|uniref:Cobyrinic acid a,c-diamide synthase n=1 Tax=Geomonas limicola TaxID=2740186 RepID=A0A6V8N477_9BACT|nr:AAA family ATPase [Geomonas limicola]GFO67348.1 cobyrinic acid a,c-diamide synthase [Geomonas limicola]